DPPPPHDLCPAAPEDLSGLCVALLRREPADRPSGAEVLARLGRAPGKPARAAAAPEGPLPGRPGALGGTAEAYTARPPAPGRGGGGWGEPARAGAGGRARPVGGRQERPGAALPGPRPRPRGSGAGGPVLRARVGAVQGAGPPGGRAGPLPARAAAPGGRGAA